MKKVILFVALILLTVVSCKKTNSVDQAPKQFAGKWRMIQVRSSLPGIVVTKPASVSGEVELTFTHSGNTTGTFTGVTPTNDIWINDFTTGNNQSMNVGSLGMTKVGETSWGIEFVDNITSARQYDFESATRLNIITTNRTLTFQKL